MQGEPTFRAEAHVLISLSLSQRPLQMPPGTHSTAGHCVGRVEQVAGTETETEAGPRATMHPELR